MRRTEDAVISSGEWRPIEDGGYPGADGTGVLTVALHGDMLIVDALDFEGNWGKTVIALGKHQRVCEFVPDEPITEARMKNVWIDFPDDSGKAIRVEFMKDGRVWVFMGQAGEWRHEIHVKTMRDLRDLVRIKGGTFIDD